MLTQSLSARLDTLLPGTTFRLEPVGGSWGQAVYRARRSTGDLAIKTGQSPIVGQARLEATMLAVLADSGLPVPEIVAVEDDLLAMEWIAADPDGLRPIHQRRAGELLATLHSTVGDAFGYREATPLGPILQDNRPTSRWHDFVRNRRIVPLTAQALGIGAITPALAERLGVLADTLGNWLGEPAHPALLHGDLWFGNILPNVGGDVVLIDPAIFHGDPEADLAYATLHASLGRPFFEAYRHHHPLDDDFFRIRRDLHLVVPLLQHAILCGPVYSHSIDRVLRRIGL